jgi:hypothetical protein
MEEQVFMRTEIPTEPLKTNELGLSKMVDAECAGHPGTFIVRKKM